MDGGRRNFVKVALGALGVGAVGAVAASPAAASAQAAGTALIPAVPMPETVIKPLMSIDEAIGKPQFIPRDQLPPSMQRALDELPCSDPVVFADEFSPQLVKHAQARATAYESPRHDPEAPRWAPDAPLPIGEPLVYDVQTFPNTDVIGIHLRVAVPHLCGKYQLGKDKQTEFGRRLERQLLAVEGVTDASNSSRDQYELTIHRGKLFCWQEILPRVEHILLEAYGASRLDTGPNALAIHGGSTYQELAPSLFTSRQLDALIGGRHVQLRDGRVAYRDPLTGKVLVSIGGGAMFDSFVTDMDYAQLELYLSRMQHARAGVMQPPGDFAEKFGKYVEADIEATRRAQSYFQVKETTRTQSVVPNHANISPSERAEEKNRKFAKAYGGTPKLRKAGGLADQYRSGKKPSHRTLLEQVDEDQA